MGNDYFDRLQKQIKGCPCCGESARVIEFGIRCTYCGLLLPAQYHGRRLKHERLVSMWNRRAEKKSWSRKIKEEVSAIHDEDIFIDDHHEAEEN